jgi:hypothetical protein
MATNPVIQFYYGQTLPPNSVAIAQVSAPNYTPADLTNINNFNILNQGNLGIWKSTSSLSGPADFTAPDYNQQVIISASDTYYIQNQFFQITDIADGSGNGLFYFQTLPLGATGVAIVDLNNNPVIAPSLTEDGVLYHSCDGGAYLLTYIDSTGFIVSTLLQYNLTISPAASPNSNNYTLVGALLTVFNSGDYYIRFTQANGIQVMPPYTNPSNMPWNVRIRSGITPPLPEQATQPYVPVSPYLFATWVPGTYLGQGIIQFERPNIYYNGAMMPDVLIFDENYNIKYALDGTPPGQISTKGYVYPWAKGLFNAIDTTNARVMVTVDIDTTDIIYAFYYYAEYDYLYGLLDVNPFTNPIIKNTQITFTYKTGGSLANKSIFYKSTNELGDVVQTNDDGSGTDTNFSYVAVGSNVSVSDLTITDARVRGGGLQDGLVDSIPLSVNFWDVGFWDGKPYPTAGGSIIYLPASILSTVSYQDIQAQIQNVLPLGCIPVIRFYNLDDSEFAL